MHRRDFLSWGAMGAGGLALPSLFAGKAIAAQELVSTLDVGFKKGLADAAMNAAKAAGGVRVFGLDGLDSAWAPVSL